MSAPERITGLRAVADRFEGVCVDQFGVMHDGQQPYPGALEALTRLTEAGKAVIVLTNSGKRAAPNVERIVSIGFPRACFTDLVSSGEVAWNGLRTGAFGPPFVAGARLGLIGKAGDDYGLDDLGLVLTEAWSTAGGLLILGSDCPRTPLAQYRALLAPAARAKVPVLCCNPDVTMLTRHGLQPSAGAIAALYAELGGAVTFVGKPHPAIYRQAGRSAGVTPDRLLAIGDSLDHDIAGGAAAGLKTALVRTGVLAALDETAFAAALAAAPHQPDYILPGLIW